MEFKTLHKAASAPHSTAPAKAKPLADFRSAGVSQAKAVAQLTSDQQVRDAETAAGAVVTDLVKTYSQGWKKKNNTNRLQTLNAAAAKDGEWTAVRAHVMLGDATTPPAGYHSKAAGDAANAEGTGVKSPNNAAAGTVYKQWTKRRGQAGNGHLKISTFFPDSWSENKIRANVLLSGRPAGDQMSDQLPLAHPGDATFYPDVARDNPPQPA